MGSYWSTEKTVCNSSCLANLNQLFAYRIVVLGLLNLNIRAKQDIPEFLTANLLLIHSITVDIDWSWNIFSSPIFCSMLIKQLIDLRNVTTENLKCRTDLPDQCIGDWSITQEMIILIAKKSLNLKIEAGPVCTYRSFTINWFQIS